MDWHCSYLVDFNVPHPMNNWKDLQKVHLTSQRLVWKIRQGGNCRLILNLFFSPSQYWQRAFDLNILFPQLFPDLQSVFRIFRRYSFMVFFFIKWICNVIFCFHFWNFILEIWPCTWNAISGFPNTLTPLPIPILIFQANHLYCLCNDRIG